MSDRQKSTVSTASADRDWERHATFRRTFLVHVSPDVAEALEEMGHGLYGLVLAHSFDPPPGSWTAARLRATAADLRFHAAHLASLAEERHASSLPSADAHLSEESLLWVQRLEETAEHIDTALDGVT
jgi:hypothetical protein